MSEADFLMIASFSPILGEAIPYIIDGGRVIITLAKVAIVAILANIIDQLTIECDLIGERPSPNKPNEKTCYYECDDGSVQILEEVPIDETCPQPLMRFRTLIH
jgi:hypothetical protein